VDCAPSALVQMPREGETFTRLRDVIGFIDYLKTRGDPN
jgi:hypothetical protein